LNQGGFKLSNFDSNQENISDEKAASVDNENQSDIEIMPFFTWEQQKGESALAFSAFCTFRDFGHNRNIKKVLLSIERDTTKLNRKYNTWRNWSTQFHWNKRAADYDKYLDRLRLTERRKTIESREEAHKQITEKMLFVVSKKLDSMNPDELNQTNVSEWVKTAIHTEREILGINSEEGGNKQNRGKQIEINFDTDFQGL